MLWAFLITSVAAETVTFEFSGYIDTIDENSNDALPGIYGLDPVRCGDLVMVDLAAPDGVPTGDCPGALELPVERWLGLVPISDAVPQDIGDGCPAVPIAVDAPVVKL